MGSISLDRCAYVSHTCTRVTRAPLRPLLSRQANEPARKVYVHAFAKFFGGKENKTYPGTERGDAVKAKCEVIENLADFQLRFYPPFVVAAVDYQKRDEGYLAIGDYISGANAAGTRLIQTQPVFLTLRPGASPSDLHKTMSVYVPSVAPAEGGGFQDLGKAPLPNDLNVRLEVEGGGLVAVGTIEGSVTPRIAEASRRDLVKAVQKAGYELTEEASQGVYQILQYGPLFSLQTRINEIIVGVKVK